MHISIKDRIVNKTQQKARRLWILLFLISLTLAILNALINMYLYDLGWKWGYLLLFGLPLLFLLGILFLYPKKDKPFLEWGGSLFRFKNRKGAIREIPYETIRSLDIHLDHVDLRLKDGGEEIVRLEEYLDFADRMRIKENFETVRKALADR